MKDTLQINLSGMHPMDTMYTKDTRMNIISTCNYHRLFNSAHYRKRGNVSGGLIYTKSAITRFYV